MTLLRPSIGQVPLTHTKQQLIYIPKSHNPTINYLLFFIALTFFRFFVLKVFPKVLISIFHKTEFCASVLCDLDQDRGILRGSGIPGASRFCCSCISHLLVALSSFMQLEKVLSFSWSGRHCRSASLALWSIKKSCSVEKRQS